MIFTYEQKHLSNPQRLYSPYESLLRGNVSKIANAKSAPIYELYLSRLQALRDAMEDKSAMLKEYSH